MKYRPFGVLLWLIIGIIPTSYAGYNQRLFVRTNPPDAEVSILNIGPKFRQGMYLAPGRYTLVISKEGFAPRRATVRITAAKKEVRMNVVLKQSKTLEEEVIDLPSFEATDDGHEQYALFVRTIPEDAEVTILNSAIVYEPGVLLPPGKYELRITKPGYPSRRQWITITKKDVYADIVLGDVEPTAMAGTSFTAQSIQDARYTLTVQTTPADAEIKIANLPVRFQQGILLRPGQYDIQVSRKDYVTRHEWVEIMDRNLTVRIALSSPPLCFFGEETGDSFAGKALSTLHMAQLKFRDNLVDVNYYIYTLPDGTASYYNFQGFKSADKLELIGLLDNEGIPEEMKTHMYIRGDKLITNVNGINGILHKINCRKI